VTGEFGVAGLDAVTAQEAGQSALPEGDRQVLEEAVQVDRPAEVGLTVRQAGAGGQMFGRTPVNSRSIAGSGDPVVGFRVAPV
jgi:hypothetical protein